MTDLTPQVGAVIAWARNTARFEDDILWIQNCDEADQHLSELVERAAALDAERARNAELEDELADAQWADALMTAQRNEAFKHLTKDQQHECIRAACRAVRPLTVERLGAAALAVLEEPQ